MAAPAPAGRAGRGQVEIGSADRYDPAVDRVVQTAGAPAREVDPGEAQAPVKTRKPDRRRARTRAAITDAAAALFDADGVQATTIDDIARAAGTSVGTIYFHFGSKEGVAAATALRAMEGFEAQLAGARDVDAPLDRLVASFDVLFRFALDHPAAFLLLAQEQQTDPDGDPAAPDPIDQVRAFLRLATADLHAAVDAGDLPGLPVDDAVTLVMATCSGLAALTLRSDELGLSREAAERALDLGRRALLSGLGQPHGGD